MKLKLLSGFLMIFSVFLINSAYSAHANFTANLTGSQENPPVTTTASGTGAFTLTNSNGLNFSITVNGLSGAITGAHFHFGEVKTNGPVVKDLTTFISGNTIKGSWKSTDTQPLNDSLIKALLTGKIYVNIHTAANPNGEIRGQVNLSAGTSFIARLDGMQENPSVMTSAKGTANIILTSVGSVGLVYNISVNGLSGAITGAHFHYGFIGQNGPVVKDITMDISGNNITGVWRTSGTGALVDSLILALFSNRLYLNIHTAANPNGEIRGQIFLDAGTGLTSIIDGMQEVPPVMTNAKGTGSYTLTDYGLYFDITVNGLSGPIQAAHFHNAATGMNGPVVRDLATFISGNSIRGLWKSNDAQPLSTNLLKEILNGNIYVNIHTSANPNGEIRGQVILKNGSGVSAMLSGGQEMPSVTTNATGTASLTANATGLQFEITVTGLSGPITGAHFHFGSIKENGPVVKDITMNFTGNTATGTWLVADPTPFNDSLRRALVNGKIYLNIHTAANPGGEIRGQVLLSAGSGMQAIFTGAQENPSVVTGAKGTGSFTLTRGGLGFNISVNGLSGSIAAAHFHMGDVGVNGPVVKDITSSISGNNINGYWRPTDMTQPLVDSLLNALLMGKLYVNIHTAANPNGEIRGQVLLMEGTGFYSVINGSQEVPPVNTPAMGSASYTISDGGFVYYGTVNGLSGNIAAAHFHNAPAGSNGGVVLDVTSRFMNNTLTGVWKRNDMTPLTQTLMNEIYDNRIYLNVHTAANPNGEIRGQVSTGNIVIVGISQIGSNVPDKFTLNQNYPNPFNPSTTIEFSINKSGLTVLKIYNVAGQEIAKVLNQNLTPGSYRVDFKANTLASGIYFYTLENNGFKETKRMMLIK
ncbi:MAG: CHRD domain-containing protein [Ignavibacteria bacterium]|nr:CHRD domain-containing protein [Ignavibacteria bacterium]